MKPLVIRFALLVVGLTERLMRRYLRRAVAEDPAFRAWVWQQRPDLDTVMRLGLDKYPQD